MDLFVILLKDFRRRDPFSNIFRLICKELYPLDMYIKVTKYKCEKCLDSDLTITLFCIVMRLSTRYIIPTFDKLQQNIASFNASQLE